MTRYCLKKILYDGTNFHAHEPLSYAEMERFLVIGYAIKNVLECNEKSFVDIK